MSLLHGGHLTHGSPVNRSGRLYKIVSYGIDPATERLNYDQIEALAKQSKPKMIIAGFTSYPWMPDWARFRQIADAVGAYLLADISHIAGMVAAGVVASPIGHAHAISFTTHKTLYGPRGACLLSTDKKLADKLDSAVFPGEQGGPHVNTIAGMAVAFKLARTPEFAQLQQQIVDNAKFMAAELERHGLHIPYGGTDTHMLLVDCKSVRAATGVSPDGGKGTPLMGDPAARILDLAGIVLNRNTIPGDKGARNPSGIRIGTPWITQRGFEAPQVARLAEIIARVLNACQPVAYAGRRGPVYHAHIDFDLLEQAKWDIVDLACCVDLGADYTAERLSAPLLHAQTEHRSQPRLGCDRDRGPAGARFLQRRDDRRRVRAQAGRVPAHLAAGAGWPADGRRGAQAAGRREHALPVADRQRRRAAGGALAARPLRRLRVHGCWRSLRQDARPGGGPPPVARRSLRLGDAAARRGRVCEGDGRLGAPQVVLDRSERPRRRCQAVCKRCRRSHGSRRRTRHCSARGSTSSTASSAPRWCRSPATRCPSNTRRCWTNIRLCARRPACST